MSRSAARSPRRNDHATPARTTKSRLADGSEVGYGYGVSLTPLAGQEAIWHSGLIEGFASLAAYWPSRDLYIVVLLNGIGATIHTPTIVDAIVAACR